MNNEEIAKLIALCGESNVQSVKKCGDTVEITFFEKRPAPTPKVEPSDAPKPRKNLMDAALGPVVEEIKKETR